MNFNSSINTGNEGIFWLKKIKEIDENMAVIMITAYGDIDLAVRSLKEGASDFMVKPWHNEKLVTTIRDILQKEIWWQCVPFFKSSQRFCYWHPTAWHTVK